MAEKFIPESQLKQAVREVLAELLLGMQPTPPTSPANRQWYDTDPAYQMLGFDHPNQLREAVRCGLLLLGHEVRDRRRTTLDCPATSSTSINAKSAFPKNQKSAILTNRN